MGKYNIAQFGTFDVENYGDLLFPEILKRELAKRIDLNQITLFSPIGGKKPFTKKTDVIPISDFYDYNKIYDYDAIIVGGGDIIRFDNNISSDYKNSDTARLLWHSPTTYAEKISVPLIWNSPGIPHKFTKEQKKIVTEICDKTDYISVRDEFSRNILFNAGVKNNISISPDTVIALFKYYSEERLKKLFLKIKSKYNLDFSNRFIIFQAAPGFINDNYPSVAEILYYLKKKYVYDVVLLPIGYCHNDFNILKKIYKEKQSEFIYLDKKINPHIIISIIANASFFIGSSLHGNMTAFASGKGFIGLNTADLTKLNGFFSLINRNNFCVKSINDIKSVFEKSYKLQDQRTPEILNSLYKKLDKHFDKIAKIIESGRNRKNRFDWLPFSPSNRFKL